MPVDPDSLDVNLISNLVRWSFHAKRRLGQEGLMEMVELYLRAGHHSRDLHEIIADICSMADEDTSIFEPDPAQDCVDLIHQLHGILAGGIPISHRLRMRFAELEKTDRVERLFARGA